MFPLASNTLFVHIGSFEVIINKVKIIQDSVTVSVHIPEDTKGRTSALGTIFLKVLNCQECQIKGMLLYLLFASLLTWTS
jgi:hypothetical protein